MHNEYKSGITIDEGLKLSLKALKKVLGDNFNVKRIDAAYININEKKFRRMTKQGIEKTVLEIKEEKKTAKK